MGKKLQAKEKEKKKKKFNEMTINKDNKKSNSPISQIKR